MLYTVVFCHRRSLADFGLDFRKRGGPLNSGPVRVPSPPDVIEEAANQLVSGVSEAAGLMEELASAHPSALQKISEELRQEDSEQTRRMAATILANAFVFQETLAGGPDRVG